MRAAAISILYRKVLSLRADNLTAMPSGKIITIISSDVERFTMAWFMHGFWISPFMITATIAIGWQQIGPSILAGIAVTFLMLPLQMHIGKRFAKARSEVAVRTDRRVNAMNDILHGMRTVKMAAWETPLSENVAQLRSDEISRIWIAAQLKAFTLSFFFAGAHFPTFAAIMTFAGQGGVLTPARVFSVFTLFGAMRMITAAWLPMGINAFNELKIATGRMEDLLNLASPELTDDEAGNNPPSGRGVRAATTNGKKEPGRLHIDNLSVSWTTNEPTTSNNLRSNGVDVLHSVSLSVAAGETAVVCGPVGSGKSTLLLAILKEITPSGGSVSISGLQVLYAPQKAWILPGTVRQNVTFTYDYDAAWFAVVIDACALTRDLELFESGADTEIGERGVTLSGGQKARLSLARAIYATKFASEASGEKCLVLLDDPFSALDPKVGREVFEKVVGGLLKEHATIVITHQAGFAESADRLLVLDHEGREVKDADLAKFAKGESEADEATVDGDVKQAGGGAAAALDAAKSAMVSRKTAKAVVVSESRDRGAIAARTYVQYLKAIGNPLAVAATFILMIAAQSSMILADFYLAEWSKLSEDEQIEERESGSYYHLKVYTAFFAAFVTFLFVRSSAYMHLTVQASRGLHNKAFRSMMRSPVRFFDQQPVGRILNRFAKDMAYVDELLPETVFDFFQLGLWTLAIVILVCILDPYTILAVSPCVVLFVYVRKFSLRTTREVKRVEAACRSPVYTHLSMTLEGLLVLHCFSGAVPAYRERFEHYMSQHTRAWYNFIVCSRWLGSRLDMIVFAITTTVTFTAVAQQESSANTGLSISYLIQLAGIFQWMVRQSAEAENQLTSCERVVEYAHLPTEEEAIPTAAADAGTVTVNRDADLQHSDGSLEVVGLSAWYADGLPNVLDGLTFSVKGGEKIGIIGRTGAGKSSLLAGLLRMVPTSGTVKIGSIPTKSLSLEALRRHINVIPQDTMLFNGSVRMNLDPFGQADDAAIWSALERVQLKRRVVECSGETIVNGQAVRTSGLLAPVLEFGSNFSVGERQLLCLARAIIKPSQILVLDEATANVDTDTDAILQSVIREHFAHCTVLTIAHRLNTIQSSDRLLVLEAGRVVEFGPPEELLRIEGGVYQSLMAAQTKVFQPGE